MDECGAAVRLRPTGKKRRTVGVRDVEQTVARIARVPVETSISEDAERLSRLESDLKAVVFGQDTAVETVANAVKRARAGLAGPEKPTGSFLFAGPTGVGKTELAKQLALTLGVPFLRFDMSEYMEKHSVSRADWCASWLRRVRPGRHPDRAGPEKPLRRASSRRDRKGAFGCLRCPSPSDGPRDLDG